MIYIVTHKPYNLRHADRYVSLNVGPMYNYQVPHNINHLNPYINELTGLYHIWKNCDDPVVGLVHYRRYFVDEYNAVLPYKKAVNLLNQCKMIVTPDYVMPVSILHQLEIEHHRDLPYLYKYIEKLDNAEPGLKLYFADRNKFNAKNMFICKKVVSDRFCEWLFPILLPIVDDFIKEDLNKVTEPRLVSFIAERLLCYWILKNDIPVYKCKIDGAP